MSSLPPSYPQTVHPQTAHPQTVHAPVPHAAGGHSEGARSEGAHAACRPDQGERYRSGAPLRAAIAIGDLAPDFEARSTRGLVRLSDYRGRWLVFFSHPADFTPVCTSEFLAFERSRARFDACGADLLALSVDSLYAHIAWVRDIEARFGTPITFPVIEDISMSVSRAYGMIHDGSSSTATVRSVFFIAPSGIVSAVIHYPMQVGRSVDEILRVLAALQAAEMGELSTPEGWRPGEPAVLAPPLDQAEADRRAPHTPRDRDTDHMSTDQGAWYMTLTEHPVGQAS